MSSIYKGEKTSCSSERCCQNAPAAQRVTTGCFPIGHCVLLP